MIIDFFSVKGKRKINEDYILSKIIEENISLHIVADGMGGYEKGDIASETVANILHETISENISCSDCNTTIEKAIYKANTKISELNIEQGGKMGTTIAGVLIANLKAYMFWVGDVKILHIRNDELIFESADHSLINQLKSNDSFVEKVDYGKIRHIVTRSIQGGNDKYNPDFHFSELRSDDKIVICSDGILDIASISDLAKLDINLMNEYSNQFDEGNDNATLIILKI